MRRQLAFPLCLASECCVATRWRANGIRAVCDRGFLLIFLN